MSVVRMSFNEVVTALADPASEAGRTPRDPDDYALIVIDEAHNLDESAHVIVLLRVAHRAHAYRPD